MIGAMVKHGVPDEPGRESRPVHLPVLPTEVLAGVIGQDPNTLEGWVVDGTLGMGGHASLILEACPGLRLLGIDQDEQALALASERLAPFGDRVRLRKGHLSGLARTIRKERIGRPVAALFDLGVSSMQIDKPERGFSFIDDGPLDMRMDLSRERTAAEIINYWDEGDLADLFYYEGDETRSRKVARAICEARRRVPFLRTAALAQLIASTLGEGGRIHPATKCFQALRRAVNEEGEELLRGLDAAEHWLADGGRLAVISFHSGEDREVKRFFKDGVRAERWDVLTKKPISAGSDERRRNRRSRSARLRIAVRKRPALDVVLSGSSRGKRGKR